MKGCDSNIRNIALARKLWCLYETPNICSEKVLCDLREFQVRGDQDKEFWKFPSCQKSTKSTKVNKKKLKAKSFWKLKLNGGISAVRKASTLSLDCKLKEVQYVLWLK